MSISTPGLDNWSSPLGQYVLAWEQALIDTTVADIFGYNALQLGMPQIDLLRESRMPFRHKIGQSWGDFPVQLSCDLRHLPIASSSIDLVLLPHVLEFHEDPHQILREVERILIPEGQVILTGFNPLSLWGIRRRFARDTANDPLFPWSGQYLSVTRAKDWLKLLGFEIERPVYGCFAPPCRTDKWLRRWQWVDGNKGHRNGGIVGGTYLLHAIKRVHGMRLIRPKWKAGTRKSKALNPITHKETPREP